MPTKREREYYQMGVQDGYRLGRLVGRGGAEEIGFTPTLRSMGRFDLLQDDVSPKRTTRPKRKLSAWQKYIKNKRNHIKFRDGKLNLKKMGVAFRRKRR
jgi:hypothetical protein